MPFSEAQALIRQSQKRNPAESRKKEFYFRGHPRQQSKTLAKAIRDTTPSNMPPRDTAVKNTDHRPPAPSPTHPSPRSPLTSVQPAAPTSSFFQADLAADVQGLQELALSCQRWAPIVGVEVTSPSSPPSSLLLDVTQLEPLYGDEASLLKKVVDSFRQQGYLVHAAIADTLGVAWGLAHYASEGFPIAPPNHQLAPLESLPIEALRLSQTTCETLHQLGITQIGPLLQLPRTSLTARFGDEINLRLDQAKGDVREVFQAIHLPIRYQTEELLEWPVKDIATTQVIIQRHVTKLCEQMKAEARGALQWQIRLFRQQAPLIKLEIKLFQPTTQPEHVLQLVEMQLDNHPELQASSQNYVSRHSPLTEVTVCVTHHVQLAERQRKLFDEDPSLNRLALAQLINCLTSRLGQEQVTRPTLQSGAQPERAFRLQPLIDPARKQNQAQPHRSHYVMARPLRLLTPALRLRPRPASQKGLPETFQTPADEIIQIHRHWGPERIETGWWRGRTVCRDYWRIETHLGAHLWVYRDRRNNQWFLHGEF